METIQDKHNDMIYPVCRVRTEKAGGSGTVIYSKPDPANPGDYLSFVLTNAHVIEDGINHKKDWDSVLKQDIKKEFLTKVEVELFDYIKTSTVNSSNTYKADIVCYDKQHDLAILKLDSPKQVENVAKIISKEDVNDKIKLLAPVLVVGCSLLHDPIPNYGYITSVKEDIENKKYCMTNANIIFGNSGGSVFLADTGEFVGVPSRVTTLQLGFGMDVVTWMGFFAAPDRVYTFLDEQMFNFIYDDTAKGYKETMADRDKKLKKALYRMKSMDNAEDNI